MNVQCIYRYTVEVHAGLCTDIQFVCALSTYITGTRLKYCLWKCQSCKSSIFIELKRYPSVLLAVCPSVCHADNLPGTVGLTHLLPTPNTVSSRVLPFAL